MVWVDISCMVWVECVGKAVRDRVCLECVSRLGQNSVRQGGSAWDGNGLNVVQ